MVSRRAVPRAVRSLGSISDPPRDSWFYHTLPFWNRRERHTAQEGVCGNRMIHRYRANVGLMSRISAQRVALLICQQCPTIGPGRS